MSLYHLTNLKLLELSSITIIIRYQISNPQLLASVLV